MEIKCTAHEKRAWFQAFNGTDVCPFEEDCFRGDKMMTCEECQRTRVKWIITDPENDVED